ncbi:MAG TPA: serine hydrolase, partial [Gemmataceae bacterium]|nr:serine hydrolase [Gemmataceae bacterium]
MMKKHYCLAGWVSFLLVGAVFAQSKPSVSISASAAIDTILRDALRFWKVPGAAVAVVKGNEVVYMKGFGVKELEGSEPVTPETLFPIASCTKAFTTTAMAMLVDEGKMTWDDPVRKHVDYFHLSDPLADSQVTLRDLLTHRTGLSGHDFLWYRAPWSREEIIRRISKVPLKNSFRSTFQYQSIMFMAAGSAVESASQTKWEDFIQKRIFDPLGMTRSSCSTTALETEANRASPHRKEREGKIAVIPWYPIPRPDPSGSINSCVRDLSRWVQFHLGDGTFQGQRLVSAKNLAETHSPQMIVPLKGPARDLNPATHQMNYGMGWVLQDYRGQFLVSHAGAIDGFRAHITLVPDAKLGIVILNNLHGTQMNLAVSNLLVDLLLGLPKKDWNFFIADQINKGEAAAAAQKPNRKIGTKPTLELSAYAGIYEDSAYGTAQVILDNGSLVWTWSTFKCVLDHFQNDTFTLQNDTIGNPQLTFTLGPGGAVAGMK